MHRNSARLHTIMSVTTTPAKDIKFSFQPRDGSSEIQISILDYYKQYHSAPVTKPRLPCVQVSGVMLGR